MLLLRIELRDKANRLLGSTLEKKCSFKEPSTQEFNDSHFNLVAQSNGGHR